MVMRKRILNFAVFCFCLLLVVSCGREEVEQELVEFEGPLHESDSIRILYSDSAVVVIVVEAPKEYTFKNEDKEFPEGIYIEFYEKDGSISSTLKADHGFLFSEENRYTGVGNVEVVGLKENSKLLTDTLHWSPGEEKVYTKDRVTIIEAGDTLRGKGLEAAQDFSSYTVLQPEGSRVLVEQDTVVSE